MKEKEIMTVDHPRWKEFYNRLSGAEGCDFKEDKNGKLTWQCKGGEDKTFAINILNTMPEIDVDKSLEYFEEHGGYCDCEIIINVENSAEPPKIIKISFEDAVRCFRGSSIDVYLLHNSIIKTIAQTEPDIENHHDAGGEFGVREEDYNKDII